MYGRKTILIYPFYVSSSLSHIQPSAKIVDPLCTFLFSIVVVFTTIKIFKESTFVLLEGVHESISFDDMENELKNIDGVM